MATFNGSIASNTDDGSVIAWTYWYPNSCWFGYEEGSLDSIDLYLRFDNVTVPYGATISSATVTLTSGETNATTSLLELWLLMKMIQLPFSSNPDGRSKTTQSAYWSVPGRTLNTSYTTSNIKSPVQAVINRAGWTSGNALGIVFRGDDEPTAWYDYYNDSSKVATISITYTTPDSPSPSRSPSSSTSRSPSRSQSPSASYSSSVSLSPSASLSPSPKRPFFGLKIAKPGHDAYLTDNPTSMIFDSNYGTLKYFDKQTLSVSFDASTGAITGRDTYSHNLGYYPYVEVFVSVEGGDYQYCPFYGAGATILYNANYTITENDITVYGDIIGMSTMTWDFNFLIFIYKNDLQL